MEKREDVIESNRMIAEFMELKPSFAHKKDEHGYTQTVDGFIKSEFEVPYAIDELKYHTSWDWIMPVVEKIEAMGYTISIAQQHCFISKGIDGSEHFAPTKIEAVHATVTTFIEFKRKGRG